LVQGELWEILKVLKGEKVHVAPDHEVWDVGDVNKTTVVKLICNRVDLCAVQEY